MVSKTFIISVQLEIKSRWKQQHLNQPVTVHLMPKIYNNSYSTHGTVWSLHDRENETLSKPEDLKDASW